MIDEPAMTVSRLRVIFPELVEIDTGGGCKALHMPVPGGKHVLITACASESSVPGDDEETVDVGLYDDDEGGEAEEMHAGESVDRVYKLLEDWTYDEEAPL